ncbi:MAG: tRNA pseudouridine(55) synthase TruB [Bacteroidota bacterium]
MLTPSTPPIDFRSGALLLVNKPIGWTSFDVVNKLRFSIRKRLQLRKIKVGHAGTLDPMASGLLLICTGKWTKRLNDLQGMPKTYTGAFALGGTTPSYDLETEIDERFPVDHIDADLLEKARLALSGPIEQMPPMFSAIKVNGQPLYKKARAGETIERKARPVEILDFRLGEVVGLPQVQTSPGPDLPAGAKVPTIAVEDHASQELASVDFLISCTKGTYIRSMAHDFGKLCASGGHLKSLCRTSIGPYVLEEAWDLDQLVEYILEGEVEEAASDT